MCLILFAYEQHPEYRLVFAANRDEVYDRPTCSLAFWRDHPTILAGRDLQGHGTWLGITRTGRLAAVTNYRDPGRQKETAVSRGLLVRDFLLDTRSPEQYLNRISRIKDRYNGFNLLLGDRTELYYYSNRGDGMRRISAGLYGISNRLLDTPWPKVQKGKAKLHSVD